MYLNIYTDETETQQDPEIHAPPPGFIERKINWKELIEKPVIMKSRVSKN